MESRQSLEFRAIFAPPQQAFEAFVRSSNTAMNRGLTIFRILIKAFGVKPSMFTFQTHATSYLGVRRTTAVAALLATWLPLGRYMVIDVRTGSDYEWRHSKGRLRCRA